MRGCSNAVTQDTLRGRQVNARSTINHYYHRYVLPPPSVHLRVALSPPAGVSCQPVANPAFGTHVASWLATEYRSDTAPNDTIPPNTQQQPSQWLLQCSGRPVPCVYRCLVTANFGTSTVPGATPHDDSTYSRNDGSIHGASIKTRPTPTTDTISRTTQHTQRPRQRRASGTRRAPS